MEVGLKCQQRLVLPGIGQPDEFISARRPRPYSWASRRRCAGASNYAAPALGLRDAGCPQVLVIALSVQGFEEPRLSAWASPSTRPSRPVIGDAIQPMLRVRS